MSELAINANQGIDIKELFAPKIKELNEIVNDIAKSGNKDKLGYVVTGISKLTSMMMDSDQHEVDLAYDAEPILTDRVIRLNRRIESVWLDYYGIDRVIVGGLFLVAPVYILPANRVNAAMKNRYRSVLKPEDFGLPSSEYADYSTIKSLSSSTYIVMAKFPNNPMNEWVRSPRHYDYVRIK